MALKWKKQWISEEAFEAAAVVDVDGNGIPDIISGGFWYEGPEFRRRHVIGDIPRYGEYHDDFSTLVLDINGNGRPDFITGGWWGGNLRWRENPENPCNPWPEHVLATDIGNVETTRAWDLDGDGVAEIIPNTPLTRDVKIFKLQRDNSGKGMGSFSTHVIWEFPEGQSQNHGLGFGDLTGNGRPDIVLCGGWLEAPEDPIEGIWKWHPDFADAPWEKASIPMLVADVNGDGRNELIVGNAHGYGLWWVESIQTSAGKREWIYHPIDPYNAQYHDLQWADIDGDGVCELVTGKRHRAHNGNESGEWDDLGIYYFKWTGEGFAKQVIDYGPMGTGKGCGIQFALADLRGTGRLDVVAPGKEGLCIYFNEGTEDH